MGERNSMMAESVRRNIRMVDKLVEKKPQTSLSMRIYQKKGATAIDPLATVDDNYRFVDEID